MSEVVVCRLEQLREGRGREVRLGPDLTCVLFRVGRRVYAVGSECLHTGAPLADGFVREGCVVCPWHGWMYDLATGRRHSTLFGDLAGGIPSYPVRVDADGQVWVETARAGE